MKVFITAVGVVAGAVGSLLGSMITEHKMRTEYEATGVKSECVEKLDVIDEKITQLAASRCMNITTPVLQMSVYSTPNVGVQKTPRKEKPDARAQERSGKAEEAKEGSGHPIVNQDRAQGEAPTLPDKVE